LTAKVSRCALAVQEMAAAQGFTIRVNNVAAGPFVCAAPHAKWAGWTETVLV
jgi:hypothetical protein